MSRPHRLRKLLDCVPLLSGLISAPVFGQEVTPPFTSAPESASTETAFGDIIVTARRRSESVGDVPATIQVLGAETLVARGIHSEADLQAAVPGLTIRTAVTSTQFNYVLRGESLDAYSGSQPGVQPYINEVAVPANSPTLLYDLENVQVLKGPQGTLFGRNSTGGAVLYQTGSAKWDFGGYASMQYGNLDRFVGEGAINLPLVADKVSLRLAGAYSSGGAFVRNLYDGSKPGDIRTKSGRATLLLKPVDGVMNNLVFQILRSSGSNAPNALYTVIPCGELGGSNSCAFAPGVPAFDSLINGTSGVFPGYPTDQVFSGGLGSLKDFLATQPRYTSWQNARFSHSARGELVANTTTWDPSSDVTLKNVFGYAHSFVANQYDNDGTPYPILQSGTETNNRGRRNSEVRNSRQISNELQLQGKAFDGRLTYILGLFFSDYRETNDSPIAGTFIIPPDVVGAFAVRYHSTLEDQSLAAFAQATYAVSDELNITLGGRYSRDRLRLNQADDSSLNVGLGRQQHHEAEPSWTASVDYHVAPSLLLYAVTRGSWRAGGYGPFSLPVGQKVTAREGGNYFPQETVRDVELGAKFSGVIGSVPVRLNVDAYNVWVKNLQKNAYVIVPGLNTIASATVAVPSAKITGVEGDLTIRPADWLTLGGNVSYTNARFINNIGFINGLPAAFGPYGDVPKITGSAFGAISFPLKGSLGSVNFRTDVYTQSHFYFSNTDDTLTPGTKIPGYTLVDMRLDWENVMDSDVTASLFVKNLGNELYYTGGAAQSLQNSIDVASFGLPRTYGLQVRVSF